MIIQKNTENDDLEMILKDMTFLDDPEIPQIKPLHLPVGIFRKPTQSYYNSSNYSKQQLQLISESSLITISINLLKTEWSKSEFLFSS